MKPLPLQMMKPLPLPPQLPPLLPVMMSFQPLSLPPLVLIHTPLPRLIRITPVCTWATYLMPGNPLSQWLRRLTLFRKISIVTIVQLLHWIFPGVVQLNASLSSHLQRTFFPGLLQVAAMFEFPNKPGPLAPSSPLIPLYPSCHLHVSYRPYVVWFQWAPFRPQTLLRAHRAMSFLD